MSANISIKELLNELEDWNSDAFSILLDYVRSQEGADAKRNVLLAVERKIKAVAGDSGNRKRAFSESEVDWLHSLIMLRNGILDDMMSEPKPFEVERLSVLNDKLLRMTKETYENTRLAWLMVRNTPYKQDDRAAYEVEGILGFTYSDEDAVIEMENDGYYASDFSYMIQLISELIENGTIVKPRGIADASGCFFYDDEERNLDLLEDSLDDGHSWNEGVFRNSAFDGITICHAIHALWDHQLYSGLDILRMDDFLVRVTATYEREERDGRDANEHTEEYRQLMRWPKEEYREK